MHSSKRTLRWDKDFLPGLIEELDYLFSGNRGEALEEVVDRVSGFEVIDQGCSRYPRPSENGSSPHDAAIGCDGAFLHRMTSWYRNTC